MARDQTSVFDAIVTFMIIVFAQTEQKLLLATWVQSTLSFGGHSV